MPDALPFRINDADNHFLEPEDMYERYIDPKQRVFGSDFPHAEGLAFPGDYVAAQLGGFSEPQVLAIMRDNLARFLGIDTNA